MNKVAQYYRELVASLSERLRNGERDMRWWNRRVSALCRPGS